MALYPRLASIIIVMALAAMTPKPGSADTAARLSDAEIDRLLAPVALYPDTLLTQILIAATYPLDVVEAARFVALHPELAGSAAVLAAAEFDWDPSVQALTAFPEVLARLDEDLRWTRALGEAFLQQQEAVMVSLQTLRQRARLAGTLEPSEHLLIEQHGERFALEAPRPDRVYVPWYDTNSAYGPWPSQQHRPVYWAPTPHHQRAFSSARMSRSSLFWGPAIHLDARYYPIRLDWHRRGVMIVDRSRGRPWQHEVRHHRAGRAGQPDSRRPSHGLSRHSDASTARRDPIDTPRHFERDQQGLRSHSRSWPQEPTASLSQRRVQAIDTRTARERLLALQAEAAATHERPDRHRSGTPPRRFEDPGETAVDRRGSHLRQPEVELEASTTMTRQHSAQRTRPEPPRSSGSSATTRSATTGSARAGKRSGPSSNPPDNAGRTTSRRFGLPSAPSLRQSRPEAAPTPRAPAPEVEVRRMLLPGSPPRRPD